MQIIKGNHSGRMQHAGARGSSGLCPPPATEQRASTLRAGLKQASERPGREGPPKFCLPGCLAPAWLHPYIIQGLLEPPWPDPSRLPSALPCLGGRNSDLWKRPAPLLVLLGPWSSQPEPAMGHADFRAAPERQGKFTSKAEMRIASWHLQFT